MNNVFLSSLMPKIQGLAIYGVMDQQIRYLSRPHQVPIALLLVLATALEV